MRKHNNFYIIGVDAGYGNMKTARTIYPTGLVAMDTKPFFDGDILEYNGTWYRIGEGHKAACWLRSANASICSRYSGLKPLPRFAYSRRNNDEDYPYDGSDPPIRAYRLHDLRVRKPRKRLYL